MPTEPDGESGLLGGVKEQLKKLPWWAYVIMAGGGLFVVWKYNQSSASAASTSNTGAPGSATDQGLSTASLAGLPFDYSMSGSPGISQIGNNNPTSSTEQGAVRQKWPNAPSYTQNFDSDKKNVHTGVPRFTTPGGSWTQMIPYGSTVTLVGPPVTGPPTGPGQNTLFFPLSDGGWIAANDLASIFSGASGSGNTGAGGPSMPGDVFRPNQGGAGENGLFSEWGHPVPGASSLAYMFGGSNSEY